MTKQFLLDIRGIGFGAELHELRGNPGSEPIDRELLAGADTEVRAAAIDQLVNGVVLVAVDPRVDFYQAPAILRAVRRTRWHARLLARLRSVRRGWVARSVPRRPV